MRQQHREVARKHEKEGQGREPEADTYESGLELSGQAHRRRDDQGARATC